MHITLDYLVAGLVIIIILTFAATSIFPFTSVTLQHVQEEQLNPLAERLLDKVILTPGEPLDWWDIYSYNETNITGFGLGYFREGAVDPYVLDPGKVSRLTDTPFQLSPRTFAKILGLTWDGDPDHLKYSFKLRIIPALNITITPDEDSMLEINIAGGGVDRVYTAFNISVKSYDGYPASNAKVKAIYLASAVKGGLDNEDVDYNLVTEEVIADWRGECYVDFTDDVGDWWNQQGPNVRRAAFILLVYAKYSGIKSAAKYESYWGDVLNATIIGNYLVVAFPQGQGGPQGARHIRALIQIGENQLSEAEITPLTEPHGESEWIINRGHYSYRVYGISGVDASRNVNVLYVFWIGRYWFSVINYPAFITNYGIPAEGRGLKVTSNYRFCRIGDLTFIVELSVWRMAE